MKTAIRHDGAEQVLIDAPMWWHEKGLSYTATGYGSKIPTRYKTRNRAGKLVRIYATCYGNASSNWFVENGSKVFIN